VIYFDNSATTKIHPEVAEAMLPYLFEEYGNPSSKYYTLATNAKKAVEQARESVAALVGCDPDEVVFTSGSTESNNMVIKGVVDYYNCNLIVTSKVEHPSVLETVQYLESKGTRAIYLDVDRFGRVDPCHLKDVLDKQETEAALVSIMWANNELGSLNDIDTLSSICRDRRIFFHTDATQAVGKHPIRLRDTGIHFLSLSAHKLHGPKGIGACIVRKNNLGIRTPLTPLLHGGGQENDYRSGTLSVHNIVGFGKAAEIALASLQDNINYLWSLEKYMVDKIKSLIPIAEFNSDMDRKVPGIINVRFRGVNNELLIRRISSIVAISTGSACSSSKPSHVLQSIGLRVDEIRSSVRISLSPMNTLDEIDRFLDTLTRG
jgi:cysteine desulfurase